MNSDKIMQNLNVLLDQETTSASENVRPEKDREFNFVLEMSSLTKLGDPGDDDKASNSSYDEITKCKKGQNMTECVPVPSSEHVAEIVGRQGCKIKALRNKTNTYIKTPVRGEEPVFVVTGRKEDVAMARRELQSAAEHFTQIRASRNRHAYLGENLAAPDGGSFTLPVRVPYRVVGLVVGPKGATIKRIQQQTHTYIVTPSRDKEPVFEVTGLPENVEKAKEEIEAHIASRTGAQQTSIDDDFRSNGTEVGSPSISVLEKFSQAMANPQLYNSESTFPQSLYNNAPQSGASSFFPAGLANPNMFSTYNTSCDQPLRPAESMSHFQSGESATQQNVMNSTYSQAVARSASHWNGSWIDDPSRSLDHPVVAQQAFGFKAFPDAAFSSQPLGSGNNSITPNGLSPSSSIGVFPRLSPTLSDKDCSSFGGTHQAARRVASDESSSSSVAKGAGVTLPLNIESGYSSGVTNSPAGSLEEGPTLDQHLAQLALGESTPERCLICNERAVAAAFVPCGHNLFCYSCADLCVKKHNPICPFCQKTVTLALRIKNKC